METLWNVVDLDSTVRDFEFTRRAVRKLSTVVYSADFEDKDAGTILHYLLSEMEVVVFGDYLKRYIYERAGIEEPFSQVPDSLYVEIIDDSFRENRAPHSFAPTTRKWTATIKGWLSQGSVKRDAVFLLGFGLRMEAEDVSQFLTRVLKEEDFDTGDPREMVFRYCYSHQLPYAYASSLLEKYENMQEELPGEPGAANTAEEQQFLEYLFQIKQERQLEQKRDAAYGYFVDLYRQTREEIASMYQWEADEIGEKTEWNEAQITAGDVERVLYSGVPLTGNGNLQKMSASSLGKHFQNKRMSRQRIDQLMKRNADVERFDMITLLFFLYSQRELDEEPETRCAHFLDEVNPMLEECGMIGMHPINPYEAVVLMCLLAETPMAAFSELWEMSYTEEE